MNSKHTLLVLCLSYLFPFATFAAETGVSAAEIPSMNRSSKKLGAYFGIQDPSPTVLGMNVAYNVTDFMRVSVGYGNIETTTGATITSDGTSTMVVTREAKATTIGAGARFMMPSRNLTPTAGLHVARIDYSGSGGLEVGGFKESGTHVYGSIGVDWQARSGFNAALGYNVSISPSGHGSVYANAGYFVDWLNR
jgi:hypothetical protein